MIKVSNKIEFGPRNIPNGILHIFVIFISKEIPLKRSGFSYIKRVTNMKKGVSKKESCFSIDVSHMKKGVSKKESCFSIGVSHMKKGVSKMESCFFIGVSHIGKKGYQKWNLDFLLHS